MTAHPALDDGWHTSVRDLIALPAEEFARISRDVCIAREAAARLEQWLDGIARIRGGA